LKHKTFLTAILPAIFFLSQFHGVGGQIFQISKETHKAFLQYLKNHPDDYWVTTFSQAMDFVTK